MFANLVKCAEFIILRPLPSLIWKISSFLTFSKIFLSGVKGTGLNSARSSCEIGIWLNLVGRMAQTASGAAAFLHTPFIGSEQRPLMQLCTEPGLCDRVDQGKVVVRERHRQHVVFRNGPEGPPGCEELYAKCSS